MDNMTTGFDVYLHGSLKIKKSFPVNSTQRFVKGAKFAESGAVFVGGSDHGDVYVFEVSTGHTREILRHGGQDELIQTVDVSTAKFDGRFQ